jgi:hypothetical protein
LAKGRRSPPQVPLREHGFRGMRATTVEDTEAEGYVPYLLNLWPEAPERGGALVPRPPLTLVAANSGVGTGPAALVNFTSAAFSDRLLQVSAHGIDYIQSGGTVTTLVSAANLSGASITVSALAERIYVVAFNQQLIVSDGVNTPWMWDGTTGGGLTKLTACPVLYGPPTVYYAKLFGIKKSDRKTIVWSEENDPTTGYEAGGFNNAWSLTQTDSNNLMRLVGANDGLYYFRQKSIGVIRGAVSADFRTTGTHDDLSTVTGAADAGAVAEGDSGLWFLSRAQRPCVLRDGQVVDLGAALDMDNNGSRQTNAFGATDFIWGPTTYTIQSVQLVPSMTSYRRTTVWYEMIRRRDAGTTETGALWLVFDEATLACLGWVLLPTQSSGFTAFRGMAPILDPGGGQGLGLIGPAGSVFALGSTSGAGDRLVDDTTESGTSTPTYRVIGRALAHDDAVEVAAVRFDATADLRATTGTYSASVAVQVLTAPAPTLDAGTATTLTVSGTAPANDAVTEAHFTLGVAATTVGRTCRIGLTLTASGTTRAVWLQGWTLWVTPTTLSPYAP